KRIHPKTSLVTWLITLGLIICPSSYKARPDNLIGLYLLTDFCEEIISPQRSDTRPNFPTSNVVGGAKFGLVSRLQEMSNLSQIAYCLFHSNQTNKTKGVHFTLCRCFDTHTQTHIKHTLNTH